MVPLPDQTQPRTPSGNNQDDQTSVTTTSRPMSPASQDPQEPPPPPPRTSAPLPGCPADIPAPSTRRPADAPPPTSRRSARTPFSTLLWRLRKPRSRDGHHTTTTATTQISRAHPGTSTDNARVTVRVHSAVAPVGSNVPSTHHHEGRLSATGQTGTKCHLHTDLLANFLLDKRGKFCDVTLVSKDGGRFPTNRGLLGARCEYFCTLLFTGFREATEDVVHVDLPATSLVAVLQYLLTGHIHGPSTTTTMTTTRRGGARQNQQEEGREQRERYVYYRQFDATVDNTKTIISYRKVADYIGCKGMHDACTAHLSSMLDRNKALACLIFEAIHTDDNGDNDEDGENNGVESSGDANRREGDGRGGCQHRGEQVRGQCTPLFIKVIDAIQTHRTTALVSRTLQSCNVSPNNNISNHTSSSSSSSSPPRRGESQGRVTWLSRTGLERLFLGERAQGAVISERMWFHVMREWYLYNVGKPLVSCGSGSGGITIRNGVRDGNDEQRKVVRPECMHDLTSKLSEHGLSLEFVMGQMEPSDLVSTGRLMQLYKWFAKRGSVKVSDCEDGLARMKASMEQREMMVRQLERRVREERGRKEEIERLRETVARINSTVVGAVQEGGRPGGDEEEEEVGGTGGQGKREA